MNMTFNSRVLLLAVLPLLAGAVKIDVSQDHADALYRAGEQAVFTVSVKDDGGTLLKSGEAKWTLDNFGTKSLGSGEVNLADGNPFTVRGKMDEEGFLRLHVKTAAKSIVWGVGYDVEKIRQAEPCPADFDDYWNSEKARLEREVPLDPRMTLDESHSTDEFNCYRVSFATFGGKRVYGFLAVPKDAASAPFRVRVSVPGAGAGGTFTRTVPGQITLFMNVHTFEPESTHEAQDAAMKRQNAALVEKFGLPDKNAYCALAGIAESREDYFYHDVMLGINRAVDWVCARPDVDLSNVSYFGSSQGGGFGLFLNYLNTHFTKAFVAVCAITGHYGFRQNRMSGWPRLIDGQPPAKRAVAERNAAYFDGVNFAARIRTPIRFLVSFADMTCPPADVYAAYNVCPSSDKAMLNAIGSGHSWFDWHARSLKTPAGFDYEKWLRVPRRMRFGCQMWGVKEFWEKNPEKGFAEVFPKLRAMGYEGVQSMAFWKIDQDRLEAMLKANGLSLADMPVNFEHVEGTNVTTTVAFCRRFGVDFVYIPWFKGKTADEWRAFCDRLDAAGRRLAPYGIRVGYHNHVHEFTEQLQGEYPANILKGDGEVNLELDIGPVAESGNDAPSWIAALSGRVPGMHAKPYGASAAGAPGDVQDWPKVIAAARKAGVKWFVVECEKRKDTYDDVAASAAYLKPLLQSSADR